MDVEMIKEIPIDDFLLSQGIEPGRRSRGGAVLWYKAPWRDESEASVKVDTEANLWVDYGEGDKGGSVIDMVMRILGIDFHRACLYLSGEKQPTHALPRLVRIAPKPRHDYEETFRPITSTHLLRYGQSRGIPPVILQSECQQVDYTATDGNRYKAIAFKSEKGWDCRNERYKRTFGGKGISVRGNGENASCVIVEGFFDYLSYRVVAVLSPHREIPRDFIVLNGVGQAGEAIAYLANSSYQKVLLCVDNDHAGDDAAKEIASALSGHGIAVVDCRRRYYPQKDLNDYLRTKFLNIKQLTNKTDIMNNENEKLLSEITKWAAEYANTGNGFPWLEEKFNAYCATNGFNADALPASDPKSLRHLFRQRVVIDALHAIHGHSPEDFRQRVEKLDAALRGVVENVNNTNNLKR